MTILILIGVIVLAIAVESAVYRRRWSEGIRTRVGFDSDRSFEGGTAELVEVVEHGGRLPFPWLTVKFRASSELTIPDSENSNVTDYYYREDMFAIKRGERITRRLPVACHKRGVYSVGSVDLLTSDIFMTQRMVENRGGGAQIVVYPKPVNVGELSFETRKVMGDVIVKRSTVEDPFVFRGIRDYVPGDPVRSVNWRASARADRMEVNQYESTASLSVELWLNVDRGAGWVEGQLVEESIRVAAGIASDFIGRGIPVGLFTNALDYMSDEETRIECGCSPQHADSICTALARIDTMKLPRHMFEVVSELAGAAQTGDLIILISQDLPMSLIKRVDELRQAGRDILWVVPAPEDEPPATERLAAFDNVFVWSVKCDG